MNYSKWIGATVISRSGERLVINKLAFNSGGEVIFRSQDGKVRLLANYKRIRLVKLKRSKVFADALEHIGSYGKLGTCCDGDNLQRHYEKIARKALSRFQNKKAKK